jgi:hypothetical protein
MALYIMSLAARSPKSHSSVERERNPQNTKGDHDGSNWNANEYHCECMAVRHSSLRTVVAALTLYSISDATITASCSLSSIGRVFHRSTVSADAPQSMQAGPLRSVLAHPSGSMSVEAQNGHGFSLVISTSALL